MIVRVLQKKNELPKLSTNKMVAFFNFRDIQTLDVGETFCLFMLQSEPSSAGSNMTEDEGFMQVSVRALFI